MIEAEGRRAKRVAGRHIRPERLGKGNTRIEHPAFPRLTNDLGTLCR
jgi:hypothetical protein